MLQKIYFTFFIVLFIGLQHFAFGQNQAMLEKEASISYSKKDFASALPAYRQLLAKDQLNPDFNFRYGHCLYEVANQNDAAKYFDLIIANQLPCDPLVYYYRGRIFQHQYFFQKAISAYQQYEKLSANQKDTYPIAELIKQCERGVLELKNFQTLPFLSTKEVERNKFYTQYPFAEEGYSIYEAAEVLPKYNAKKGNVPIYCYRRAMKYRILALDDGSGQLDLYIQKKDAANNWAKLIKIEGEVNSSKNEAFGFYDEESQILYFSSETNSIGGYDIFKAQLDLQTGKSSTLERLPYPYASPDDDLLFVMDRTRGQVYFSSNRAGQAGRCEIYSLALDQEKQTPFVFAGTFSNQNDNKQLKASLSFTDLNTETQFGPFLSDENGDYLIVLPEKGSFRLSIQLEGASKAYETTFVIPVLKENEQLKQVVRYELNEYGREKYTVINSIIPSDLEKQVDLIAQAQLKWQAKEIKQVQFKSTAPRISDRSPLLSQFAWADSDTAALVNQLTDTLLAAEVSLENQVRLTEVLRKDFELKLAERERFISSGDVEALDQISQELAFIQTWLNINQAANIPNIEILSKIQQTNEKIAAWQHAGQKDSILNYLESVGGELSKYLQIAAFDGENALQIEQYKAQMALQEQAKALQLEKQNRLKIQDQLKVQEKNLALQSKKEQETTQKRIDQLKQQLALSELNIDILSSKLQEQEAYVATFEQATQKETYLSQSEQQNLPDIDLSMSMEELLSQYAQQEVLIKSMKDGDLSLNSENQTKEELITNSEKINKEESTINSEKKGEQLAQEVSISNSEKLNKEGSNPNSEKREEQLAQEEITLNSEKVNKEELKPNSEKKEEQLAQEASISNLEKVNKEDLKPNSEKKEEQLAKEEITLNSENQTKEESISNLENQSKENSISNSEKINKEGSNPISEKKGEQLAQEASISNLEKVNKERSNPISEKKGEQLAQEESNSNSEKVNKEGSNPISEKKEEQLAQEASISNSEKVNQVEPNPIAEKKEEQLAQEETISNSEKVNQEESNPISEKKGEQLAQEASISNLEKVNKERSNPISEKKGEQLAQEASISNSEKVNKEGSNPISEKREEQLAQEASISNSEKVNKEGSNPISERKEEQLAQEASISNSEQINKEGSNPISEKKEEQLAQEESISNSEMQAKEELIINSEKVNKEELKPNSEKKEEQLAQEEITLNSENQTKEELITNSEKINKEGSNPISETKEEQLAQEASISNSEKRANTNIETIQKLAEVSRQLNGEEGQLIETEIPSVSISAQELGELAQAIELPKASKLTETELASEQWLAYMKYLEARDAMERYKEQISNLNEEIKDLEVSYLETPTDEVQQALLEKAEAQQVAIEQLKRTQQGLLKQPLQAEFEALFEMGYLPPYELAENNESATSESGYNPLPEGQMASFKVAQQAPGSSIPIGVPCAQGLVFRVQVGAFRKPIPAGKFTEFSPVDGRVLANGLTVVMAGYFRSSTDAINQRNDIRRLGYADAFVVAYNGCERLNYAAAVQLESTNKGINTQQVRKSVFETPGEGLYYTVQVGVYNRPLLSEKQLGLPELIEAQTAKGQYRYASGRFAQLAAAKERQRLAVQKGITDAFIVAYYQGKRISLAEAKTLMAQGVQMDTQTTKPKDLSPKPTALPLQTVPVLPAKKALQAAPTFVRYEQTCSDCQARLAALNRAGIFIYQTENGILSSAQMKADELTALQRYMLRGMKINTQTLTGPFKTLSIEEGQMNGAQMDWLLRQGSPYKLTQESKESILISVEIK